MVNVSQDESKEEAEKKRLQQEQEAQKLQQLTQELLALTESSTELEVQLQPQAFEKDDDTNFHVDFIYGTRIFYSMTSHHRFCVPVSLWALLFRCLNLALLLMSSVSVVCSFCEPPRSQLPHCRVLEASLQDGCRKDHSCCGHHHRGRHGAGAHGALQGARKTLGCILIGPNQLRHLIVILRHSAPARFEATSLDDPRHVSEHRGQYVRVHGTQSPASHQDHRLRSGTFVCVVEQLNG